MNTPTRIEIVPVFGGTISVVDGVTVEIVTRINNERGDEFYIGLGQPGFNSPANNRSGYATAKAAAAASNRYARKSGRLESIR